MENCTLPGMFLAMITAAMSSPLCRHSSSGCRDGAADKVKPPCTLGLNAEHADGQIQCHISLEPLNSALPLDLRFRNVRIPGINLIYSFAAASTER